MGKELIVYQGDLHQLCVDKFSGNVDAMAKSFAKADVVVLSHVATIKLPNGGVDAAYPKIGALLKGIKSANSKCKIFGYVPGTADAPIGTTCGYQVASDKWAPTDGVATHFMHWTDQWASHKEVDGIFVDLVCSIFMSTAVRDSIFSYVKLRGLNVMANTPISKDSVQFGLDSSYMGRGDYIHVEAYGVIAGTLNSEMASTINRAMATYSVNGKTPRERGINLAALITEAYSTTSKASVSASSKHFLEAQAIFNSGYVPGDVLQYTTADLGVVSNNIQIESHAIADLMHACDSIFAEIEALKTKTTFARGVELLAEASGKLKEIGFIRLNLEASKTLIDKTLAELFEALKLHGSASSQVALKIAIASENIKSVLPLVEQHGNNFKKQKEIIDAILQKLKLEDEKEKEKLRFETALKKIDEVISVIGRMMASSEEMIGRAKLNLQKVSVPVKGERALELLLKAQKSIGMASHFCDSIADALRLAKERLSEANMSTNPAKADIMSLALLNIESLLPLANTYFRDVEQNISEANACVKALKVYQGRESTYTASVRSVIDKFEIVLRQIEDSIKKVSENLNAGMIKYRNRREFASKLETGGEQIAFASEHLQSIVHVKKLADEINADLQGILFSTTLTDEEANKKIARAADTLETMFASIKPDIKKAQSLTEAAQANINAVEKSVIESSRVAEARQAGFQAPKQHLLISSGMKITAVVPKGSVQVVQVIHSGYRLGGTTRPL